MSTRTEPTDPTGSSAPTAPRRPLGLAVPTLLGLALLGAPRVILHDVGILEEGTAVNLVFVVVPPVIWVVVAVAARVPRPFLTLLVVGALYGVLLATVHQLLWGAAFPGGAPALGGNLADLDPALQAVIVRAAAALSSVLTGVVVGAVTGLLAEAVRAVIRAAGAGR